MIDCGRVLKHSYVYGYFYSGDFLCDDVYYELYLYQQQMLEVNTNSLWGMIKLDKEWTKSELERVNTLTTATHKFMEFMKQNNSNVACNLTSSKIEEDA